MEEYQKKIRNLGKTDEVELKISKLLNNYSDILKKYVAEITKKL